MEILLGILFLAVGIAFITPAGARYLARTNERPYLLQRPATVTGARILGAFLVAAGCAFFVPGERLDDVPAASSAACDDIGGAELARDDRWRIVLVFERYEGGEVPLIACRAGAPAPAAVRVLARSKVEDEDGQEGGPYVSVRNLAGGRVLLATAHYAQVGDALVAADRETLTLVNLDRGARATLPGTFRSEYDAQEEEVVSHALYATLTPAGGLAYAFSRRDGADAPARVDPLTIWDADGRRTAPGRPTEFEASAGTEAPGDDGFYLRDASGKASRVALRGAADLGGDADEALRWQNIALPREPDADQDADGDAATDGDVAEGPATEGGSAGGGSAADATGEGSSLLRPPSTTTGESYAIDRSPWVHRRPATSSGPARAWITADFEGTGRRLAILAPGPASELRTLAGSDEATLVVGRFAEHPEQRRLRLIGGTAEARRFFDLAATAAVERRENVALTRGRYAVAADGSLRVWRPGGGTVHRIAGAHDPVFSSRDPDAVYVTDGAGRVQYLTR